MSNALRSLQVVSCYPQYETDPEVVLADLVKEATVETDTPATRDIPAAVQLLAEGTSLVSALLVRRQSPARTLALSTVLSHRALLQPIEYESDRMRR